MPQIKLTDFTSGWIPADDAINGRKNGLLKMDSVTLDENGAIVLAGGTKKIEFEYPAKAHTLFSKYVCGERRRYVALEDGSVYRNETEIIAAGEGSLTRAAFGLVANSVLITSGATKIKDICDIGVGNLGLTAPDEEIDIQVIEGLVDAEPIGEPANFTFNSSFSIGSGTVTAAADGSLELFVDGAAGTIGRTVAINSSSADFPKDLSGSSDDLFRFKFKTTSFVNSGQLSIAFQTTTGQALVDVFNTFTGVNNSYTIFEIRRSMFTITGTFDWANVQQVAIWMDTRVENTDITVNLLDFQFFSTAEGALNGTYEWVQVNVYNVPGFVTRSGPSPVSLSYSIINGRAYLTPFDPTIDEPLANEVWFYRRGGNLPDFYRVGVMSMDELGVFEDNMSDADALVLGITLDDDELTVAAGITDDILEIVGPVHRRMLYFTATQLFFGEIDNPDAFNPARTINITNSEAEEFLWARKVAENVVLVGTTVDIYALTGTWVTYPDGVIDVELRPLGLDKPPISRDVAVYKGSVVYFSARGWTIMALSNDYATLVNPSTGLIYDGLTRYEYGGVPVAVEPSYRYSIVIARDRMYCIAPVITDYTDTASREDRTTWGKRLEIYEFLQKYWRPSPYSPWLLEVEEDGTVLGFYDTDNTLAEIDYAHSKLLNFVE